MKPYNFSPKRKKLVLKTLLLGSLGFTLSMSPEHFNNIVRNDINSGVFELAATSEEAHDLLRINEAAASAKAADQRTKNNEAAQRNLLATVPKKDSGSNSADPYNTWGEDGRAEAAYKKQSNGNGANNPEEAYRTWGEAGRAEVAHAGKSARQSDAGSQSGVRRLTVEQMEALMAKYASEASSAEIRKAKEEITASILTELRREGLAREARNQANLPQGSQTAATAGANPAPGTSRPEVGTANVSTPAAATPGSAAPAPIYRDVVLSNKDLCRAYFTKENDKVVAKVEKVTEAMPCGSQGNHNLKGSIGDLANLEKELKALIDKEDSKVTKAEKDKETQKEKLEALKEKYEELAEKCEEDGDSRSKSYEGKLSCLKDLMIKFAKETKDIKDAKRELASFFNAKVAPTIKTGLSRSIWEIGYDGVARMNTEKIDAAQETLLSLVQSLPAKNTQGIISILANLNASSLKTQAGFAKEIYMQSQNDKTSTDLSVRSAALFNERVMANFLSQPFQKSSFGRNYNEWADALDSSGKSAQLDDVKAKLFSPTLTWMNQLPTETDYLTVDLDKKTKAATKLSRMNLSGFGLGSGFMGESLLITEGTLSSGGLPASLTFESRLKQQADPRVNGIADITTRGSKATVNTGTAGTATLKTRGVRGATLN